jgi:hypothetical protein
MRPLQGNFAKLLESAVLRTTAFGVSDERDASVLCMQPDSADGAGPLYHFMIARGDVVQFDKGLVVRMSGQIETGVPTLIADPKTGLAGYVCGQFLSGP